MTSLTHSPPLSPSLLTPFWGTTSLNERKEKGAEGRKELNPFWRKVFAPLSEWRMRGKREREEGAREWKSGRSGKWWKYGSIISRNKLIYTLGNNSVGGGRIEHKSCDGIHILPEKSISKYLKFLCSIYLSLLHVIHPPTILILSLFLLFLFSHSLSLSAIRKIQKL